MADAYTGEIRLLPYNYAPDGWLPCNGQQIAIAQYNVLYAVIGSIYGAATPTQFYLPDLRSRAPMGSGTACPAGTTQGNNSVTLNANQVPAHNHPVIANAYPSTSNTPAANMRFGLDTASGFMGYKAPPNTQAANMIANIISPVGQNQPHENRQPYLAMQFCICYDGFFPVKP